MSAPTQTRVRQLADHSRLYAPGAAMLSTSARTRRDVPDAIVVPASRPASAIEPMIDLAANLGTELVVLCSRQTSVDQVAERMERRHGSRGVVASVEGCAAPAGKKTSGAQFHVENSGRCSDLSMKRNLGLLLARRRGWSKIVFVDDDIRLKPEDMPIIARQLDRHPIAGMRCVDYFDNSVLCHARRLAKLRQGVFVTGAVLGVNVDAPGLGFFPDIYNEDWFFFGEAAAARSLPKPRPATQDEYNPYKFPQRARHEEFGDLLAEGLYALIESSGLGSFEQVVEHAGESFWEGFIEDRRGIIDSVSATLVSYRDGRNPGADVDPAIAALAAARNAYDRAITPEACVAFLSGWRDDVADWDRELRTPMTLASSEDAMTLLGASDVRPVRPWLSS